MKKFLCIGPMWRGSNAGGLFKALSRQGVLIEVVDEFYYLSLMGRSFLARAIYRLIRPFQIKEFNKVISEKINLFSPDVLFVYKGAFVTNETLKFAKSKGCSVVNFFPDVSLFAHGSLLPKVLPKYDLVFTTKSFGIKDLLEKLGVNNSTFIPHGFDPEIHRPLSIDLSKTAFACDVSFIGTWTPVKEEWLRYLKEQLPAVKLFIWGNEWEKLKSKEVLLNSVKKKGIHGDLYQLGISASKINLGLLAEKMLGSSSGDLITSRTFHIPAIGGFLLHQRNVESTQYFVEGKEAAFFSTKEELVSQIVFYLSNEQVRQEIAKAGQKKALENYSLDHRAKIILKTLEQQNLLSSREVIHGI